jgi:hypothetical protein
MHFNSRTQYDSKYSNMGSFGSSCSACSLFALTVSKLFMDDTIINSETDYNNMLDTIIKNTVKLNINSFLSFDELLNRFVKKTDHLTNNKIEGTSHYILNDIGPAPFFKLDHLAKYAIIFLKNSKFFVVTVDNNKYSIYDCHEICQYTYSNFNDLMGHLNLIYQFNKEVVVGGLTIPEFNNIEYLIIDDSFELKIDL